jgi:hypothetical protein
MAEALRKGKHPTRARALFWTKAKTIRLKAAPSQPIFCALDTKHD